MSPQLATSATIEAFHEPPAAVSAATGHADVVAAVSAHVDRVWADEIVPSLHDYIAIPCVSVAFDPEWHAHGHLDAAVELVRAWCAGRRIAGLVVRGIVDMDDAEEMIRDTAYWLVKRAYKFENK